MMTWDQYEGVPIGIFIPGNIFGDLEVYKNTRRLFCCRAVSRVEAFSMTKQDFRRILFIRFPVLGKVYLNVMDFKLLELEKVMQIIVTTMFDGKGLGIIVEFLIMVVILVSPVLKKILIVLYIGYVTGFSKLGYSTYFLMTLYILEELSNQSERISTVRRHLKYESIGTYQPSCKTGSEPSERFIVDSVPRDENFPLSQKQTLQSKDFQKNFTLSLTTKKSQKKLKLTKSRSMAVKPMNLSLESADFCRVPEEESESLDQKDRLLHQMGIGRGRLLKEQKEQVLSNKREMMESMSFTETRPPRMRKPSPLLQKEDSEEEGPGFADSGGRPASSRFRKLVTRCSFQIEGQNSILRNTVLTDLVNKYSHRSVAKETADLSKKPSSQFLSRRALLRRIEELQKANQGLRERNRDLSANQGVLAARIEGLAEYVDGLQ